jgi:spore coat protein JB
MMQRDSLLKQVTALDFVTVDLGLYLDTHPNDQLAIEEYNKTVLEAQAIRADYEKLYGPVCSFRVPNNGDNFAWINGPWPWEKEFNY